MQNLPSVSWLRPGLLLSDIFLRVYTRPFPEGKVRIFPNPVLLKNYTYC